MNDWEPCGAEDECVLEKGHGGHLHASAVGANLLRVCWAVEGHEALVVETFGENPFWMSMR